VNQILLRCMKQARYSADNIGHFGLASPCYLHFTSPIRRYPDLVVHRILKERLAGGMKKDDALPAAAYLPATAEQSSRRERNAMEAEREIVDLKRLQYMEGRVGEVFEGFITGVASVGFFAELEEFPVEGLVHISSLPHDYYLLLEKQHTLMGERSGRRFRVGDRVTVRVENVSMERKRVGFALAEAEQPVPSWRGTRQAKVFPPAPAPFRGARGKGPRPGRPGKKR